MIAITTDQNFWFDLAESIAYALQTEVWRTAGKYRTKAGRCQHGDDSFDAIWRIGRYAVPRGHAMAL